MMNMMEIYDDDNNDYWSWLDIIFFRFQKEEKSHKYHISTVLNVLRSVRYGSAFLAVTWLSITIGVAKSFDFWYIETLGMYFFPKYRVSPKSLYPCTSS